MILRRISEHVSTQNWFAVVLDFVIVVAGVFIGIQVANWNQAQADVRLGHVYAERLTADLEQDLASRRALVAYYGAVLQGVERADALLADPQSDPKELVVNAYRASEINYIAGIRATWDEIVSSGDTGLLPHGAGESAAYYAFDSARSSFDKLWDSAYRHRVRTIIPLDVQKAIRAGCSDVRDQAQEITGFMPDCTLAIAPAVIAATASALRADPRLRAELSYQYSEVWSTRANISGDVVLLERALAQFQGQPPAATAVLP